MLGGDGTIARQLRDSGWHVHTEPADVDQLRLVLVELPAMAADPQEATGVLADTLALAGRYQPVLERAGGRAAFVTLTRLDGAFGLEDADGPAAVLGAVTGLVKTLAIEAPELFCRALDIAPDITADDCAELVLAELADPRRDLPQVAHRDGRRRTLTSTPLAAPPAAGSAVGPDDLMVVTGGGRGITAHCATALAERTGCGLILLGRSPLPDEPDWAHGIPDDRLRAAIVAQRRAAGQQPTPREVEAEFRGLAAAREVRATLAAIRATGAAAEYAVADVADTESVRAALAPHRDRITGFVHGAGVLADQRIADKAPDDAARVLAPKVHGWFAVLAALDLDRLRHVAAFSSIAGWRGNAGQADYAMANEALNRLAAALHRTRDGIHTVALNWGAWAGGMVTPELARLFTERGVPLIPVDEGVRVFTDRMIAPAADQLVIVGPDAPLTGPAPAGPTGGPVDRSLAPLSADPAVLAHAIDGKPVLPMTGALGAMLNVADPTARAARQIVVYRGVVLGESGPAELRFETTAADGGTQVTVRDESGRPRYRAELLTAPPEAAPARHGLPPLDGGEAIDVYTDGTLFHGPALQGIRRLLADGDTGLITACRLRDPGLGGGAYGTAGYQPALLDLLLQSLSVWVRRHHGVSSLPSRAAGFRLYHRLPDDTPFYAIVENVVSEGSVHRATLVACAEDGTVLAVFDDLEAVGAAALNDKFRVSAR
ncbi:SDR family NAD(P)-dependent oxidoreductase [Catellatospora bangladeshensis]|uniref:Ketoreductase domain-containing protein n=1 Tax=Catellatospora bangladeshensis TaxID=310355 RepID=A0A8J3JJB3_9ACTN|nr:SDR family NAD(P)-dependent oxidoreductase [Catellatospora bangladeshensis]GIF85806.1 hypothetical protein Cba03nite_71550 [Catellatospora bangladeshensis]